MATWCPLFYFKGFLIYKDMNYSEKLKSPKWQKKRLEIMKRDKFMCVLCKDEHTELHVHHTSYYDGLEPWDYDNWELKTLCKHCHETITYFGKNKEIVEEYPFHCYKFTKLSFKNNKTIVFAAIGHTMCIAIFEKETMHDCFYNNHVDITRSLIKTLKNTTIYGV